MVLLLEQGPDSRCLCAECRCKWHGLEVWLIKVIINPNQLLTLNYKKMPNPDLKPDTKEGEPEIGASADEGNVEAATRAQVGYTLDASADGRPVVGPKPLREGIYVGGSPYWKPGTEPPRTRS